jgi:hypothetical protein
MKYLFQEYSWIATVNWSRPVLYQNAKIDYYDAEEYANLYKITGKYSSYDPKLFYIGKTFRQYVTDRLNQPDHVTRYNELTAKYPKHILYVSFGTIQLEYGKLIQTRVDEIETLLIYSHWRKELINKRKIGLLTVEEQYIIYNRGYSMPLHKEIKYGISVK